MFQHRVLYRVTEWVLRGVDHPNTVHTEYHVVHVYYVTVPSGAQYSRYSCVDCTVQGEYKTRR
jgi:hypothetical protein